MKTILRLALSVGLVSVVACGDDGGSGPADAPTAPAMIAVSGTASEIGISGRTPLAGVAIQAFAEGGATAVASATSAADGTYTLTITTGGVALDGYVLAKIAGRKDTYLYPPGPLAADTNAATVLMLTQQTFEAAAALAQATQEPGKGWIGVMVVDAQNNPIAGATVSSTPAGMVKYNGTNGLPSGAATETFTDGIGYIFNVNAGTVMVNAAKSGSSFRAHPVNARADQVTTTLVQ